MKKLNVPDKMILVGKLMRVFGGLGIVVVVCQGIYFIAQQGGEEWKLLALLGVVVLSFALLAIGDFLIRIGTRKRIEAQIRRRNDEK